MKKDEFLKKNGLKIRKVTNKDRISAKTDYQRNSNYIIKTKSGKEYFSKNGSVADCKTVLGLNKPKTTKTTKKPAKPTTVKKCVNTQKNTVASTSMFKNKNLGKSEDRVIRNYIEKDNHKVRIVKAPNGKYFNEYTSHGAGAGPFQTFKEAKTMLHKHRPTAKKVTNKTTKRPAKTTRKKK